MKKKYIEPSIEEGQRLRRLWNSVTERPMSSREVEFARTVERSMREVAVSEFKERVLQLLDMPMQDILLAAGDLTAQEQRDVVTSSYA